MAQFSGCGCRTECTCVVIGGRGVEVTGTGNIDDPYIVASDGSIDCQAVMTCVCQSVNTMQGVECVDGRLQANISADPGNDLTIGTDGGLKVACQDCVPDPNSCDQTLDGLRAQIADGRFIYGTFAGSRNLVPYGDIRSYDYAASIMSPVNVDFAYNLQGCAVGIAPYPRWSSARWVSAPAILNLIDPVSPSGDGLEYQNVNPAQWLSVTKNVGSLPTGGLNLPYYDAGFDQPYADGALLMSQVFAHYLRRSVFTWFLTSPTTHAAVTRTIRWWCAQPNTILFHWDPAYINASTDNDIEKGIAVHAGPAQPDMPWTNNYRPGIAQDATAAQWAAVSMQLSDAQIQDVVAAGKPTFGFDTARQSDIARAKTLGLVGFLSDDMLYQRSGDPEVSAEEKCWAPLDHDTWAVDAAMAGQIWPPQNTSSFRNQRGYPKISATPQPPNNVQVGCWHLPANFGDYTGEGSEATDTLPALLVGAMCNHPNMQDPQGWDLNYWSSWVDDTESLAGNLGLPAPQNPNSTVSRMGIFICAPDDRNISGPNASAGGSQTNKAVGYFCWIRPVNGQIGIMARLPNGTAVEMASSATTTALRANELNEYRIQVTPTTLFFTHNRPEGSPAQSVVSVPYHAQVPRTGRYFFLVKEELAGPEWECRVANMRVRAL